MSNVECRTLNVERMEKDLETKKYDLEDRLIVRLRRTLLVIEIVELLPNNKVGNHIGGQLLRSGTSPAFNYGEAQSAESRNDFIHKMRVCLKELRESRIAFKIILRKPLVRQPEKVERALKECNELIAIFVKSISTAEKNRRSAK